ncbi:hypothetical protein [Sphingomonas sanguinis]|jgi:hypothetical protein|uniref:Uncharacterized protein n=1 Tax=Sphingomonas sanguinis TaxID=33051 RepID=A0A7Y7QWC0_9SPHN|nr:hypothetical protein [Sphingomonas sanguinis]MBZ6382603.1 hypothetical protein [Sphingomonas sanguinis]NNG50112.1 hypothetical protein [Sphingomonas sanguinis]NNG54488.1 hypothetical protein [Sphingomonas sanguinis]NVP31902.1 hypothetical protein [Sphingomonas sanguinis]
MASDRDEAKSHIIRRDARDAELDTTLGAANQYQLEITREQNRHEEAKRDKELGVFGKLLGGEKTAPVVVAMIVVLIGFFVAIGSLIVAICQPENAEFWSKQAERGFGVGSAALAYIFGKGSN